MLKYLFILLLFSSCEVLKKRQEVRKDSVAVVKTDSGAVRVNTTTKTDSLAWWREIINFGRDTTIVVTPTNNIYPTSYIREGGTQRTETKVINYDSLWNTKIDSLVSKFSKMDKSSETKVLSMWQILGLCAGAYIVLQILGKVNISQIFTKK